MRVWCLVFYDSRCIKINAICFKIESLFLWIIEQEVKEGKKEKLRDTGYGKPETKT